MITFISGLIFNLMLELFIIFESDYPKGHQWHRNFIIIIISSILGPINLEMIVSRNCSSCNGTNNKVWVYFVFLPYIQSCFGHESGALINSRIVINWTRWKFCFSLKVNLYNWNARYWCCKTFLMFGDWQRCRTSEIFHNHNILPFTCKSLLSRKNRILAKFSQSYVSVQSITQKFDWDVCMYVAILKPQGLWQSGSSLHLGNGQSREFDLQAIKW